MAIGPTGLDQGRTHRTVRAPRSSIATRATRVEGHKLAPPHHAAGRRVEQDEAGTFVPFCEIVVAQSHGEVVPDSSPPGPEHEHPACRLVIEVTNSYPGPGGRPRCPSPDRSSSRGGRRRPSLRDGDPNLRTVESVRCLGAGFERATGLSGPDRCLEQQTLGTSDVRVVAEHAQNREVEAGIGQVQDEGVFTVEAATSRLGDLASDEFSTYYRRTATGASRLGVSVGCKRSWNRAAKRSSS
jgi:hypothetical protein